jgi:hypothetical protein
MKYVIYSQYMLLDDYGALQDRFGRVLGQNGKFGTTYPKKLAISENFANSEILQTGPRPRVANSDFLCSCQLAFGLLHNVGSVVHSEAFLSMIYNFITPKQHLGNAHNIKRSLK